MSRKGNCRDNAVAESFFKSLKCEMIYGNRISSAQQIELFPVITDPAKNHRMQYETGLSMQNRRLKRLAKLAGIDIMKIFAGSGQGSAKYIYLCCQELFDTIAPQNAEMRTVAKSLPQISQNPTNSL